MLLKERLKRKKYMEVLRWWSELMARIINRILRMVTRYMARDRLKMRGYSSGSSANPRRRNLEICLLSGFYVGDDNKMGRKQQNVWATVTIVVGRFGKCIFFIITLS
jgi:hypothetical protein